MKSIALVFVLVSTIWCIPVSGQEVTKEDHISVVKQTDKNSEAIRKLVANAKRQDQILKQGWQVGDLSTRNRFVPVTSGASVVLLVPTTCAPSYSAGAVPTFVTTAPSPRAMAELEEDPLYQAMKAKLDDHDGRIKKVEESHAELEKRVTALDTSLDGRIDQRVDKKLEDFQKEMEKQFESLRALITRNASPPPSTPAEAPAE